MTENIRHSLLAIAAAGLIAAISAVAQSSGQYAGQAPATPAQPAANQVQPMSAQPGSGATAPANAQPAGPGVKDSGHGRVNEVDDRLQAQKNRIQQGLKNGTLTQEQARQLWRKDKAVAAQERKDMAANGGHLTGQEQKQLNKQLNQNSKKIYKEKHDQ